MKITFFATTPLAFDAPSLGNAGIISPYIRRHTLYK